MATGVRGQWEVAHGCESRLVLWRLRAAEFAELHTTNQYNPQLTKAGFQSFPRPSAAQLATLTAQVATNNHFSSTESDRATPRSWRPCARASST
jgi:hypothetical protein